MNICRRTRLESLFAHVNPANSYTDSAGCFRYGRGSVLTYPYFTKMHRFSFGHMSQINALQILIILCVPFIPLTTANISRLYLISNRIWAYNKSKTWPRELSRDGEICIKNPNNIPYRRWKGNKAAAHTSGIVCGRKMDQPNQGNRHHSALCPYEQTVSCSTRV